MKDATDDGLEGEDPGTEPWEEDQMVQVWKELGAKLRALRAGKALGRTVVDLPARPRPGRAI